MVDRTDSPWLIDRGVARDLAALVGWAPGTGATALVGALAEQVPSGTLAKRAAVAAGEVPPGADPEAIARRIIDDRSSGRPTPSWSCWALSTVMAALVATLDRVPVRVAATRRIDDGSPPVDLHSVVVVDATICDPFFASVVPGPGVDQHVGVHRGKWSRRTDEPDGRWSLEVGDGRGSRHLAYRLVAPTLDGDDVRALCAVSATHSGAPTGPTAALWRADRATDVWAHAAGGAEVREWRRDAPDAVWEGTETRRSHPTWEAASADFAVRTGISVA